ncbi:uracil-xanthine permease family protein [Cyanobium sp. NIES-981]|uniref:uracil-xanthine permease family protein n=1 Tax=Cyanobium sp. NIES-981 TaxID=1851505 RepID=UPI0007DDE520|nr:solute carrier family 23 protein [Cyanobium sp. NIES-981]SBO44943.1 Xanthine/uracil permease [Cyanobium sp. NIES-981]
MERPPEIAYWIDERPPPLKLALLGLQHAVVICPYLVLVALVVEAAGIRSSQAAPYIGMAMVAVVLHALLQARRWPLLGSGYLCPPIVSAIYLPASLSAASVGGLPLVAGMVVFAAATEMLLSRLVTSLRRVFPAVVSGIILMAVGIELAKIALGIVLDARLAGTASFGPVELIFGVAVGVMVGLSVWGRGPMKLFCALLGILAGYGLATALGQLSPVLTTNFAAAQPFAVPLLAPAGVAFHWDFVFPFLLAGVASGLRTVGVITTCQQMNDSSWSKPDTRSLRGGVLADGLGCALGGLFATPGLSVSPTLAGIQRATGATSRAIVWSLAVWFLLLACLPKLATLIVHMPKPVMAAALFFNGSFMLVGGMEIAFRRPVAIRETFTIGIALILAMGSVIYPGFFKALPAWTQPITASPIAIATIAAVGLNLLFLLGRRRSSQLDLSLEDQPATNRQLNRFVRDRAKVWKLPARESERILRTLDDLTDQILASNANTGPIALSLAYDDYDVTAELTYEGSLVQTRTARFIREPSEEQAFISGLSCFLVDVNADRIEPTCQGGVCRLRLVFQI